MRIAFFGEDAFSVIVLQSLLEAGHEICGVFTPHYDNLIYKRLEGFCLKNNLDFHREKKINSEEVVEKINKLNLDLIVVSHFERILKKPIIDSPRLGCLNMHPSILPNYRGLAPQHWPIINGDKYTGVTVHFIDEGVDTGRIVLQEKVEIDPNDYVFDLQNKFRNIYKFLMKNAVELVSKNPDIGLIQSNEKGSHYGRLKIEDCIITKEMTTVDAYNLIRGVSFPYFGARFENYRIWSATPQDASNQQMPLGIHIIEEKVFLQLKDGQLELNKFEKL